MKIRKCGKGLIYDIGFIDPYVVNEYSLHRHAKETEDILVWALRRQETKREILFPYNFQ
jgi:hypothetical protein